MVESFSLNMNKVDWFRDGIHKGLVVVQVEKKSWTRFVLKIESIHWRSNFRAGRKSFSTLIPILCLNIWKTVLINDEFIFIFDASGWFRTRILSEWNFASNIQWRSYIFVRRESISLWSCDSRPAILLESCYRYLMRIGSGAICNASLIQLPY